jgi:uncharacterized protein (DUF302 family)
MELSRFAFGYAGSVPASFDQALQRTKEVLSDHGFGVQAEIDIAQALKTKIGIDMPREVILGVCNPRLAYRAMQEEPHVTLMLPCTITVKETPTGAHIAAADAQMLVTVTQNAALANIAAEAEALILKALAEL